MSKVGRWSTTAANNNATPPDGWPEGQASSTVNDCARENMAAIKTAMQDMDFFDHDFTPTFINANSFSVPGDQTARIVAGRQLKLYDATTHIRDVGSASFTTVTTISLGAGTALTSSLSSFAVSIINPNSSALPNSFNRFSASAVEVTATLTASSAAILANLGVAGYLSASAGQVTGVLSTSSIVATGPVTLGTTLSVSGATVLTTTLTVGGAVALNAGVSVSGATVLNGTLSLSGTATLGSTLSVSGAAVVKGALSVGGAVTVAGTLSVSGTVVAANVAKGWVSIYLSVGGVNVFSSFNVTSVSRSATGVAKVNFTTAFVDAAYLANIAITGIAGPAGAADISRSTATCKFTARKANNSAVDELFADIIFYR